MVGAALGTSLCERAKEESVGLPSLPLTRVEGGALGASLVRKNVADDDG
jgi:hypothetical protein